VAKRRKVKLRAGDVKEKKKEKKRNKSNKIIPKPDETTTNCIR
jgi:hypothetical protein